jgi:hypothetical protein
MGLAGIAIAFLLQSPTMAAPAPPPLQCEGLEYAALDFWVGEWDVYPNGQDTPVGRSRIEKLYKGCAIRENWMPNSGNDGGSLSGYNPATKRWRQTWIGGAAGQAYFEGGTVDGKLVLTGWWAGSGPNGEAGLTRMTYSRQENGAVRQLGEFSADHGLTWGPSFDFIYRPRKKDAS